MDIVLLCLVVKGADVPENRKLAAILAADVVGSGGLLLPTRRNACAAACAVQRLIAPTIALHHGRVVKRTGDGGIVEFRSVVDAVRCAIEVQNGMVERNAGFRPSAASSSASASISAMWSRRATAT